MLLDVGHVWAGQCVSLHHSPNRPLFATENKKRRSSCLAVSLCSCALQGTFVNNHLRHA